MRDHWSKPEKIDSEYLELLSAAHLIRELINELSPENPTIRSFNKFISVNIENNITITDESTFISSEEAVQLLTIHKAKGLEFEYVFIVDAIDKNFTPRSYRRKPPANLPLQPPGEEPDDYARLMYVAVSRAKSNVTISSYQKEANGKEVIESPLVLDIAPLEQIKTKPASSPQILKTALTWPRLSTKNEKLLLKSTMRSYRLSVTHLINYLDVTNGGPLNFLERNILRLPESKSPALAFGSAVHAALDTAQRLTNKGEMSLQKVLSAFETSLKLEILEKQEFVRRLEHGKIIIKNLLLNEEFNLVKDSLSEYKVADVTLANAKLSGTFDRLDISDNKLSIIDYKTGRAVSNINSKSQADAVRAWRHKTQLTFYAVLAKHSEELSKYALENTQMIYVESDTNKSLKLSFVPSDEDIEKLEKLIAKVWKRINVLNFEDTSSYETNINGITLFIDHILLK